ncbi:hypothetical protein PAXRUDRAFT_250248 [Paxillus rubicundulus Ve08.2h10]|uniref:Unplaced genomic scaffold scaffold_1283, whole genome shotgun sequence n=1 Tax=Paxillus rubicundulus Ve08.2h10 TaxID=930991 RepID=A0A0D0CX07_9AGAM|nr:hypothetical protein PAXRUDRAFT_250248 [Paxillus rubicundulus Ve08.2h10]
MGRIFVLDGRSSVLQLHASGFPTVCATSSLKVHQIRERSIGLLTLAAIPRSSRPALPLKSHLLSRGKAVTMADNFLVPRTPGMSAYSQESDEL